MADGYALPCSGMALALCGMALALCEQYFMARPVSPLPSSSFARIPLARPGLALASSSSSSGGGLSLAGETLADDLIAGQATSANAPPGLSAIPSPTVTVGSLVATESPPPLTPTTVTKPTEPSGGKAVINSSVKRALFQEESPPPEAECQADSAAQTQIGLALVGDAATPPAPSTAASEKKPTGSRQPSLGKNKVESQSKKKRT